MTANDDRAGGVKWLYRILLFGPVGATHLPGSLLLRRPSGHVRFVLSQFCSGRDALPGDIGVASALRDSVKAVVLRPPLARSEP